MGTPNKRKDIMEDDKNAKRPKKECPYGDKCYRLNPIHFKEYSHEHLESILDSYTGIGDFPLPSKFNTQKQMYVDQLKMLIHKQLYAPGKNFEAEASCSTTPNQSSSSENKTKEKIEQALKVPETNISKSPVSKDKSPVRKDKSPRTKDKSPVPKDKSPVSRSGDSKTVRSRSGDVRSPMSRSGDSVGESRGEGSRSAPSVSRKKDTEYRQIVPPVGRPQDYLSVVLPQGKMAAKHAAAAPYYIFYTTIAAAKETHTQPYSITLSEILDHSLGELKCSLQINFMVDIAWLLAQYYFAGYRDKKLTILYGEESPDLKTIATKKPQVDAHMVQMSTPFGKHHTKMMILCYENGSLRVVISTANLYWDDWENRTQGLWFSPSCPELPPDAMPHDGESPTMFKRSLLRYLHHYHLPQLGYYVDRVKRCDFSHINVFLVASVPGSHFDCDWGMTRAGSLLRQHCSIPPEDNRLWPLVAQASSIGSFGKEPKLWLTGDFLHNFTKIKNQSQLLSSPPELKIVYPSLENVRQSHDDLLGGGCLPYAADAHAKQMWLMSYLYQWQAKSSHRNKAMPHLKSYTRVSGDRAAYYLLTSANISKAAWGQLNKGNGALRIMSYEAGVLFLPSFVINQDYFPLQKQAKNRLIIPYDFPLTKYTADMSAWVSDYLR
ncbi:probable tyrosyl-DNA phosphodiesterase [Trichoplusia ni]|uniref:Probable tyrosyl-DNA phosphodiesterase n=1 Tax=Trichoplusia ni TaxID=7111 RepID=A0A7E5VBB3_TRINI|nr:probable tyrosyl-DNA phosphodiesterase [Trichoplusia ni]